MCDFYRKIENVVGYQEIPINSHENIFRSDRMFLERYMRMGIRHPGLDIFEKDARIYRDI